MRQIVLIAICSLASFLAMSAEPIRVLIIDGRNNHDWRKTTSAIEATLRSTGRFTVDVSAAPQGYPAPMPVKIKSNDAAAQADYENAVKNWKELEKAYTKEHQGDWDAWRPAFEKYSVVVNNYNGNDWPQAVKDSFVEFVRRGGGVVNVHAANNAFTGWADFNAMIGIGWRGDKFGARIAVDDETGKPVVVPAEQEKVTNKGFGSGHGSKHAFVIKIRDASNPIVAGMPTLWLHGKDELYHRMRGSAENLHVIASAFSESNEGGTDMHEPMIWWLQFGQGKVVTTSMGHAWLGDKQWDALECVGFQTVLVRSVEWAATGNVTIPLPAKFPTADKTSSIDPAEFGSLLKTKEAGL